MKYLMILLAMLFAGSVFADGAAVAQAKKLGLQPNEICLITAVYNAQNKNFLNACKAECDQAGLPFQYPAALPSKSCGLLPGNMAYKCQCE